MKEIIKGARNPEDKSKNQDTLKLLVKNYKSSEYNYDVYLHSYLSQRKHQVNLINSFYTATVSQDEPQITVYSEAVVPNYLVTHQTVYILSLNILPNVSTEKFSYWLKKGEQERTNAWYDSKILLGKLGVLWRNFRAFYHLNKYRV